MEKVVKDNQLIFKLTSDLVASRLEELVGKARLYLEEGKNYDGMVIDMSGITKVDSKGITFVIGIYKSAKGMGKEFKISGVNEDILWLFQLMKLDKLFPVESR